MKKIQQFPIFRFRLMRIHWIKCTRIFRSEVCLNQLLRSTERSKQVLTIQLLQSTDRSKQVLTICRVRFEPNLSLLGIADYSVFVSFSSLNLLRSATILSASVVMILQFSVILCIRAFNSSLEAVTSSVAAAVLSVPRCTVSIPSAIWLIMSLICSVSVVT